MHPQYTTDFHVYKTYIKIEIFKKGEIWEFPLWCYWIYGVLGALGCRFDPQPSTVG